MKTLDIGSWQFASQCRTATLATLSDRGRPRLVPICFVLSSEELDSRLPPSALYSPLDEKPKSASDVRRLARVRDIKRQPQVTMLFERWSEDWARLAWVRAEGTANLIEPDDQRGAHAWAVGALRRKYPQYRDQRIESLPVIRVLIDHAVSWRAEDEAATGSPGS